MKSGESVVSGVVPLDDDGGDELKPKSSDGSGVSEGEAAEEREGHMGFDELFSRVGPDDISVSTVTRGASIW